MKVISTFSATLRRGRVHLDSFGAISELLITQNNGRDFCYVIDFSGSSIGRYADWQEVITMVVDKPTNLLKRNKELLSINTGIENMLKANGIRKTLLHVIGNDATTRLGTMRIVKKKFGGYTVSGSATETYSRLASLLEVHLDGGRVMYGIINLSKGVDTPMNFCSRISSIICDENLFEDTTEQELYSVGRERYKLGKK